LVYVGTSGYSYDDWIGPFYPPDLPKSEFLTHYAERFQCVEINMTYYRIPAPRQCAAWVRRTPSDFLFAVKANRLMTHERDNPDSLDAFPQFREAIQPIQEAGRLGCVLLQFPQSFGLSDANSDHLVFVRDQLPDMPLVCEFRSAQWADESTLGLLRQLDLGYCCVDEPSIPGLMPRVAVATSPLGYLRFHGRNAAKWYDHEEAFERYDYLYQPHELAEWVPKVGELAAATDHLFVFFNNHYNAQAVANADLFMEMLVEANLDVAGA